MQTGKLMEMGTDSVRLRSLADATPVPKYMNGTMRKRLQNQQTGEWFYSYCDIHHDYHPDCTTCRWRY
jgi:hypothetical protein